MSLRRDFGLELLNNAKTFETWRLLVTLNSFYIWKEHKPLGVRDGMLRFGHEMFPDACVSKAWSCSSIEK
jgi:hypothetical protein